MCVSQAEKFWSSFFKSSWGLKGQSPSSTVATVETPKTSEKFLFLLLFLLAKGEKEEMNSLKIENGLSHFGKFSLVRQPLFIVYILRPAEELVCNLTVTGT